MSQIAKSDFFPKWWGKVLLQTYDHFFAEFLNEESPVRLGIFYTNLPVSVCGTDPLLINPTRFFLGTSSPKFPDITSGFS